MNLRMLAFAPFLVSALASRLSASPVPLFDGRSLAGWEIPAGEEKWWRVHEGAITGGSLEEQTTSNLFLSTPKDYRNFELKFRIRLVKGEGFMNSGVQVRSIREPGKPSMKGYQVDAGAGYWGDLYDEHRRDAKMGSALDPAALKAAVKDWEWNDYRILCEGRRIRSWINGVPALDFTEKDSAIPLDGKIGFQVHSGGKCLVQVKEITIDELPDSPGAPSWKPAPAPVPAPAAEKAPALSGADELKAFKLPPGFVAELVASEEQGVGKPISMAWDARGRLWTMTAFEYPIDGNENMAVAEALYARGGRDKVLVFDDPSAPLPLKPRVFAEGLAIPLGILPGLDGNSALVHHGSQIRRYVDADGDGKSDRFDVVLDGFGIQDSHLMPHQFERAPGGWIYVAQGLFNYSKVRRPGNAPFADGSTEKVFNQCKLARFRPDGSDFELLTAGPNNIWGFAEGRNGETWLQEANDIGIAAAEFEAGAHYATGSKDKLRPYAPQIPASMTTMMGGTGLSGLALADDRDSPFAKQYGGAEVMYLANPITNRIQVISTARTDGAHPDYYKREDFLVSEDPWFRPVSCHFGPDGFLYIADWYNKIISHNEVPRNHPDRDKIHGRLWRIRPVEVVAPKPVDLTGLADAELVKLLDGKSSRQSAMAAALLTERKTRSQDAVLSNVVSDSTAPVGRRVAALRVLEESGKLDAAQFASLASDASREIRYEAVRAAVELKLAPADFVKAFSTLPADPDYRVRAGFANAVRRHPEADARMLALVAKLGRAPLIGQGYWQIYDREFERYLARWAMEEHRAATEDMLTRNPALEPEARLLAIQSLAPERAAARLVAELPALDRPLTQDELSILGGQLGQPVVLAGFEAVLSDPAKRKPVMVNLTRLDASQLANPALAKVVSTACSALLKDEPGTANRPLVLQLAKLFRLADLEPVIAGWAEDGSPAETVSAVAALREMKSERVALFLKLLDSPEEAVSREALGALAAANDPKVVPLIAERWDKLPGALKSLAVDGLTSDKAKASAMAGLAAKGGFKNLDGGALERLLRVLGDQDPAMAELLKQHEGLLARVLRLPGKPDAVVPLGVNLEGPFTVEAWIKLDAGIDASDNLLGRKGGGADLNFYDGRFRLFGGQGIGDVIIANRKMEAEVWTHVALTRDAAGALKIYLDGELDQDKGRAFPAPLTGLNLGETNAGKGSAARYDEFRIWDVARSADEIRGAFHTRYAGAPVAHLVKRLSGDQPGTIKPPVTIELVRDFPPLVTPEQAVAKQETFNRFRGMAGKGGDAVAGRAVFQATCMMCHQVKGEGMQIGPDLSGAGAMGVEGLLRNVLDPNAQLESGYYRHEVSLKDGSMVSGFLMEESKEALTIRPIGAEPRVIPRGVIASHEISKRTLMPEGLLDSFTEKQVADLFRYLNTLK